MGRYTVVEDVALADCAMDIEGRDAGDLFETAARALAELMIDPGTLPVTVERTIELEAAQVDLLLFDWLGELIFRKDRDREVFPEARVRISGDGPVRLAASVRGGVIDPAGTERRADPKAVTLHQLRVTADETGWRARVVIDI
ncbi:MAG TPA: archease [Methylomirabilota bacterium]|jgi:SHS2 domain-containing protein|nr:archease [Methylomirabilota bacterium]